MNIKHICYLFSALMLLTSNGTLSDDKIQQIVSMAKDYCGSCHSMPNPNVAPKKSWPRIIETMNEIALKKYGKAIIDANQTRDITAFYYGTAPENLPVLPYNKPSDRLTFKQHVVGATQAMPLITNIKLAAINGDKSTDFIVSDMSNNAVFLLSKENGKWNEKKIADISTSVYADIIDYDGDLDKDMLIGDIGVLPYTDKQVGKIFLLRKQKDGAFSKELLTDGIGRIAEVRAIDVDNDADLDIMVAAFGGGDSGEIFWLENQGNKHAKRTLLKVTGALNIMPWDINKDGHMDFISLISQEHELFMAFINQGNKQFTQSVLARGPHPMFGSTSMRLLDLDLDGDTDVLFTNGDAYDTQNDLKPYHGVQWLENLDGKTFKFRDIGRFYGAALALAGDMDNDGDLDVVAGSFMNDWNDPKRQSMVWFENDGKQNFIQHDLIAKPASIASFELADVTGDGYLDIIAGSLRLDLLFKMNNSSDKSKDAKPSPTPRVVILENMGRK
ncbi:FG-GAP repeat domain-containing protein [Cellvibrio sp.]